MIPCFCRYCGGELKETLLPWGWDGETGERVFRKERKCIKCVVTSLSCHDHWWFNPFNKKWELLNEDN